MLLILDRLHDLPAAVLSDWGEVLAQNTMSVALSGDCVGTNVIHGWFTAPGTRALVPPENHEAHGRAFVASLRAVAAARPDDPGPAALVAELRTASREFEKLWQLHDVVVHRPSPKRILHPVVGVLDLDCEGLLSDDHGQRLVVHSARPGTQTYERLELLRVVGVQDLTPKPVGEAGAASGVGCGTAPSVSSDPARKERRAEIAPEIPHRPSPERRCPPRGPPSLSELCGAGRSGGSLSGV
ncbi:MmyB family transcriptional regulator [Streptomyces sp. NPDC054765]